MNKAVMISIQPKWCELIASGKKAIEVRKSKPKLDTPFKCYIYCTNQKIMGELLLRNGKLIGQNRGFRETGDIPVAGKVIGEFICDYIDETYPIIFNSPDKYIYLGDWVKNKANTKNTCLSLKELSNYGNGKPLYAWDISQLKIYDKSKDLSEFKRMCGCYDDEMHCADYCSFYKLGMCDGRCSKLTRPPQSWCYVEELEE